ncbi:type II toxin-antitoxin system RelE/ParE family toxin [Chryseobacterium wangxinyae]|uniref:type II toxin-antitoxin system RelE/ParE family toxin n=1 Tax=Chryseobacterium sp. CY353 TaxID=2997334 RepID=UPI00226F7340|nr:type II toxin-antitoxin system RelE/ParE family toxin [Chryseobacterium sp. CY353]MCY0969342.1 type II toxin-antitoxin system RelE/ParE family toxin [Chryseobacterium sp. CY353]
MVKIKIEWSHFAKQQRDEIFIYWNNRNKSTVYSKKLKSIIKEKTNQLKIQPLSGKKTSEENIRILILKNYSLFYTITPETIYIISFWENHQNPEKLNTILGL